MSLIEILFHLQKLGSKKAIEQELDDLADAMDPAIRKHILASFNMRGQLIGALPRSGTYRISIKANRGRAKKSA